MSSLYQGASQVLTQFLLTKSPLTSLIFSPSSSSSSLASSSSHHQSQQQSASIPPSQSRAVYALTLGVLRYKSVLDHVIESTNIPEVKKLNRALLLCMLYDLLLSQSKSISGGGSLKKLLLSHQNSFRSSLTRLRIAQGIRDDEDLLPEQLRGANKLPRYVRVNTMRCSEEDVHRVLKQEGFVKVDTPTLTAAAAANKKSIAAESATSAAAAPSVDTSKHYHADPHIPHLLVFSSSVDFHAHELLTSGCIILQDKASCMTATVLDPSPSEQDDDTFHVLDACAAPGNKTTHLLAIAMEHARKSRKNVTQNGGGANASATHKPHRASHTSSHDDIDENDFNPSRIPVATGQSVSFDIGATGAAKAKQQQPKPKIQLEAFEVDPVRYQLLTKMMTRALPPFSVVSSSSSAASQGGNANGKKKDGKHHHQHNSEQPNIASSILPSPTLLPCPAAPAARVTLTNRSFLDVSPSDPSYSNVRAILLDPTCSGSGMLHRIEQFYKHRVESLPVTNKKSGVLGGMLTRLLPAGTEKPDVMQGVAQLAEFQKGILTHALSFPKVECVVYSTCSVHTAEDEAVVDYILSTHPDFTLAPALPHWYRRGEWSNDTGLTREQAQMCVRSAGAKDGCNGFFVAKFVRKSVASGNNKKSKSKNAKQASSTSSPSSSSTPTSSKQVTGQKRPREEEEEAEDEGEADTADDTAMTDSAAVPAAGKQTARNKKKREKAKLKKQKLQEST